MLPVWYYLNLIHYSRNTETFNWLLKFYFIYIFYMIASQQKVLQMERDDYTPEMLLVRSYPYMDRKGTMQDWNATFISYKAYFSTQEHHSDRQTILRQEQIIRWYYDLGETLENSASWLILTILVIIISLFSGIQLSIITCICILIGYSTTLAYIMQVESRTTPLVRWLMP